MGEPGTFCWNELMTIDPEAAGRFLAALTGCRIETMPMPDGEGGSYRLMMQGDRPVGGIMAMAPGLPAHVPPHWTSYLAVADVDADCRQTVALGGRVIRAPWDVPGVGRIAIIADPTGAALALITPPAQAG